MLKQIGQRLTGNKNDHHDEQSRIEKLEYVFPRRPDEPALGVKAGILPTTAETTKLYVMSKLFSHAPFSHEISKHLKTQKPTFMAMTGAQQVKVYGKTANAKNCVYLYDNQGDLFGAVLQRIHMSTQTFSICSLQPAVKGQSPTDDDDVDHPLYVWAKVSIKPKQVFVMDTMYEGGRYTVKRSDHGGGILAQKPWIVTYQDHAAAVLRPGEFPTDISGPAWNVTVAPGIDPCLFIGLVAAMDTQTL